jgi:hypothetical protein
MKQSININIHDGQQFSFYKNALGQIPFPSSIHPAPRDRATKIRKYQNHSANLQQRAEINRMRANSYHGIGRHAGVKIGH